MVALLDSMTGDHPARPTLVLSNRIDAGGLAKARARNVATTVVDHRPFNGDRAAFEFELNKALDDARPDIICLAGFMRILTSEFIDRWAGQMINIHPSLLPKYTGLDTHARALSAGDVEHGCSVHEVTATLDDGPILGQARLKIAQTDTAETLSARVLKLEHQLYPAVLHRFASDDRTVITLP